MITRRGVLAILAGAVMDPDRLLWKPGAKLISIPAPPPLPIMDKERCTLIRWAASTEYHQWEVIIPGEPAAVLEARTGELRAMLRTCADLVRRGLPPGRILRFRGGWKPDAES